MTRTTGKEQRISEPRVDYLRGESPSLRAGGPEDIQGRWKPSTIVDAPYLALENSIRKIYREEVSWEDKVRAVCQEKEANRRKGDQPNNCQSCSTNEKGCKNVCRRSNTEKKGCQSSCSSESCQDDWKVEEKMRTICRQELNRESRFEEWRKQEVTRIVKEECKKWYDGEVGEMATKEELIAIVREECDNWQQMPETEVSPRGEEIVQRKADKVVRHDRSENPKWQRVGRNVRTTRDEATTNSPGCATVPRGNLNDSRWQNCTAISQTCKTVLKEDLVDQDSEEREIHKPRIYRGGTSNKEQTEYEKYVYRLYEPANEGKSRRVDIDKDNNEMNIHGSILLGQEEVPVKLLLDTGAQRSFISRKVYEKKLAGKARKQKCFIRMYGIGGQELDTTGECELDIQVGQDVIRQKFIIANIQEEGILGYDFCKNHQAEWRWKDSELELTTKKGNGVEKQKPKEKGRVIVMEQVQIPARSEVVVSGMVMGPKDTTTGMVQPLPAFTEKYGVVLAAAVCRPEDTRIPLRLMNVGDQEIVINKHETVGSMEEVEVLQEERVRRSSTTIGEWDPRTVFKEEVQNIGEEVAEQFFQLVEKYEHQFMREGKALGHTGMVQHQIHTDGHPPIKQRPRREPLGMQDVVKEELIKMEAQGIIEPSNSPWASPVVLVKKKDGTIRFCIDYRKLNEVTLKDAYPLPRIEDNLDALKGARWFTTLDLASGYWQVEMDPGDKEKTAFCTRYGLYQFKNMPFGLCNAPGTFERLMETVLRGMQWERAVLYLDDIIIFSSNLTEHLERLEEMFQRLQKANLMLKPSKCHFFKRQVEFLGHIVSEDGVHTDPEKIEAVKNWGTPRRVKDVRSFLGLTGYYRRFIKDYGGLAKPLHELTEKNTAFEWNEKREEAFQNLKQALTQAPILGYPSAEQDDLFILDTDASNCHIGAVLSQRQNGQEKVISFGSKVLNKAERNYCVTRRELLAVVFFIVHYKHYLIGRKFLLRTDHGALTWLFKFKAPEGQVARWLEALSTYDFDIVHRAGKLHGNGDGMSRRPCPDSCPTCKRGELREEAEIRRTYKRTTMKVKGRTARTREKARRGRGEEHRTEWMKRIKKAQEEDRRLQLFSRWGQKPDWQTVANEEIEVKMMWSRWPQIKKRGEVWFYNWREQGQDQWKVIVPESLREEVMKEHHDGNTAGHLGIRKTIERIEKSPYYWPSMRKRVTAWVMNCDVCQRTKPDIRKQRAPMGRCMTGAPLERVAIDVMGPLPETVRGNKYIVVIGDYFTKWMEAYATPNHRAETIAKVVVEGFISRFGIPSTIHTDQGRDFESNLFRDMCKRMEIEKTRTTPWHPQSDGMVERFNRTLETMLRQTIQTNQSDWDLQAPICCMAYRASVHETTKQTPNMLMLGRELPMPSHLQVQCPDGKPAKPDVHTYVQDMEERIQASHKIARESAAKGMRHQKRQYDKRAGVPQLKAGDVVWLYNPTKKVGRSPKLQSRWEEEPYLVEKVLSQLTIEIKAWNGRKRRVIHRNLIKLVADQGKWKLKVQERMQEEAAAQPIRGPEPRMGVDHLGIPYVN